MRKTLLAALAVAALVPVPALAADFPSETIKIVVGFTPGGSSDLVARLLAPTMADDLGTPVIVENQPGAASTIAGAAVAKAKPDGYTIFLSNVSASSIAPFTYKELKYDPVADFDDISVLGYIPAVLLANPKLPIASLEEFVAYVKANPGTVNFGSGGHGTMNHITGELLNLEAGLDMAHIAYKGSAEAMNDLLAGVIPFQVDALTQNVGQIKAGAVKALAITTPQRSPAAPDVPTFSELGYPNIVAYNWVGLSAPKGTPPAVLDRLYAAISKAMAKEDVKKQFEGWGMFHVGTSPAEAETFVAGEIAKWGKVVKSSKAFQ